MLYAEIPAWVEEAGIIFGTLLAFTGFMGIVLKSKPGKWVAAQIAEDVVAWVDKRVDLRIDTHVDERLDEMMPQHLKPVLYELRSNGGGSFRDSVMRELRELNRRMDRFSTFMDESAMDRRDLRRLFQEEIARTKSAESGAVDDRESDE